MERTTKVRLMSKCLALLTSLALSLNCGLWAATTTVGSANQLKGNGVNSVTVLPSQMATMSCTSVSISTISPTQVLAANTGRADYTIVNVSTVVFSGGGAFYLNRAPIVWLTTTTATNLGNNPAQSNLNLLNGIPISSCFGQSASTLYPGTPCSYREAGTSVYRGIVYALAESSSTASFNQQAQVQACEYTP